MLFRSEMPDFLPDKMEAGTHNVPGIAGLLEGIRFVAKQKEGAILKHEQALTAQAVSGLKAISGITVFHARRPENQAGVLSVLVDGVDCEEVGARLGERNIAVRAGLHCAPFAHESAGTLKTGTVRISFSHFSTPYDVKRLVQEMSRISG